MDNTALLIQRITDAQHNASVGVLIPLLMSGQTNQAAAQEWKMFATLAELYTESASPKSALDYPLEFLNWVLAHQNLTGAKDYIKYIAAAATAANAANSNGVSNEPFIAGAMKTLALHNITII